MTKRFNGVVSTCAHKVYFWFKTPNQITPQLKEVLKEEALRRSHEMISKDGCTSGELNYETDKISATGWWCIDD